MFPIWSRLLIVAAMFFPAVAAAGEIKVQVSDETICGPDAETDPAAWLEQMKQWRQQQRAKLEYTGAQYARPELLWAQRSFIQPQMMVEDRYFYDPLAGKYTVDRYLNDVERRYGGIDSVLIWPVYPNIGIDNRNQHDMLHDMPGGLPGVRRAVDDFHRRGVRVLFPVMPWDTGTRQEDVPLWAAAARDMRQIDADGLNGDTMSGIDREFRQASDMLGHPLVLEPEGHFKDEAMLAWNNMSWGYWKYQPVPVVSKYKWTESRHMVNVCERWAKDRTNGMQSAFFNGVGYESWENVWGIWNQFTPRDAEALRRIATIERAMAELLISPDWEPHVPTLQRTAGVYASKFPGRGQTLWLLVNRSDKDAQGSQLEVAPASGTRFYDLWHGTALKPATSDRAATLAFEIEAHGYGALLAVEGDSVPAALTTLLARMAELSRTPLASLSAQWNVLPQQLVEIAPTKPAANPPEGMVLVPAGKFLFKVAGVEIEGNNDPGVDVQYPWEQAPGRHHEKELELKAFYIDKVPVTNSQFKQFVDSSKYRPVDDHNFLRDWKNGTYPEGWANKPVTWVSLEDARAYAAWAGKRLPHEWEWQYAAQGSDGRMYPWGNEPDAAAVPQQENGRTLRGPTAVDAYPRGASPFGVLDLLGNVWQWTDEYVDEHTRAAILRGGSYYRPAGSKWYFPQNTRLDQHGKYLLIGPSKDRAATLGFRCVADR
jgi:gamma-glutamyl hercynylcysteine S-oxide synthase